MIPSDSVLLLVFSRGLRGGGVTSGGHNSYFCDTCTPCVCSVDCWLNDCDYRRLPLCGQAVLNPSLRCACSARLGLSTTLRDPQNHASSPNALLFLCTDTQHSFVLLCGDLNGVPHDPNSAIHDYTMKPDSPFEVLTVSDAASHGTTMNTRSRAFLDFPVNLQHQLSQLSSKVRRARRSPGTEILLSWGLQCLFPCLLVVACPLILCHLVQAMADAMQHQNVCYVDLLFVTASQPRPRDGPGMFGAVHMGHTAGPCQAPCNQGYLPRNGGVLMGHKGWESPPPFSPVFPCLYPLPPRFGKSDFLGMEPTPEPAPLDP